MSTTSQLTTFSDLYTDLLNRIRADTTQSATVTQAKRYINIGLTDMHLGTNYKFPWAERQAILQVRPMYQVGTVTISQGSASATGASTTWNTNDVYGTPNVRSQGKIVFAGSNDTYTVQSVSSNTALTLTQPFIGTSLSASSYTYFEDEYALASDFGRPVEWASFDIDRLITFPPRNEFYRRFTRNNVPGKPKWALMIDKAFSIGGSTARVRRLVLGPPPDTTYLFPYRYITVNLAVTSAGVEATALSNDTDEPIVPLEYRHAILYHALYNWYRDKKDDTRSQEALQAYTDIMVRTLADVEIGARQPTLQPNMEQYAQTAYHPYDNRGSNGYYTTGSWFDRGGW